jgi:hypothetical protein
MVNADVSVVRPISKDVASLYAGKMQALRVRRKRPGSRNLCSIAMRKLIVVR